MFCQKCGNEIKEEQTFCRMCGEQVSTTEISLPESSLVKRASFFSLGVIGSLVFLLLYIFLRRVFYLSDNLIFIILLITTLISSGLITLLLMEMKEIKRTIGKVTDKKEFKAFYKEPIQIEEKPFIPISWSVTDRTTDNLLSTKSRISGEL